MIGRLKEAAKKEKDVLQIKLPRHVAITMDGIETWAVKNDISFEDAYHKAFLILRSTVRSQVKLKIPITSFYVLDESYDKESESYGPFLDAISSMFNELASSEFINENKVKISVLGKWYNLPGRVVDSIKNAIEETKDYDSYFVNFCINYSGQGEIVDAVKLLGMQIRAGKVDPELIDKELIKENLYTSYFLPPNLAIKNGNTKSTGGFLLWDSVKAKIYFTNKLFPDFDRTEFMDAIREYQKGG